jgi:hypothetical protein
MTSQYGAYALRAGLARLYARICLQHPRARVRNARTHAQECTHRPICDTYYFSTATVIPRTRHLVTLYVHC